MEGLWCAQTCDACLCVCVLTRWNLHNLPFANGSLLRHVPHVINGINVPWLYIGMLFASFAWHVEDNYLLSISYLHAGSPKVWYGSPATSASDLERTMKSQVHARFVETPDLLYHVRACCVAVRASLSSWTSRCSSPLISPARALARSHSW